MTRSTLLVQPLVMACALLMIALVYWPGLYGPFLFDDAGNLDVLGAYGRIVDGRTLLYYLTSGTADPFGRPLSLLTFLVDAQAWPADPWPFKRTNLILHLVNTALLAWTIHQLQAAVGRHRPDWAMSAWTPLLAAALWGAHPLLVSTTLYVVQRQAMLPMVFVLLALLAWLQSVRVFDQGRTVTGWAWAVLGVGGATLLAGLSKANGFLAPLLIGVTHLLLLRPAMSTRTRGASDYAAAVCLGIPAALVLGYLSYTGWQLWSLPELRGRDWTLPERLLSQPRALWDYVARLALPRAGGGGVYVDDFAASRGWMMPATTLPALLALLASVVAAIAGRRRMPLLAFAWLFFLAAHLLESSSIPLELYFEHRNYLPAMFLGWPIAHALLRPGAHAGYRYALAVLLIAALLLLTHARATLWGNDAILAALSAEHAEESPRAQVAAAQQDIERGDLQAGLARMASAQRGHPHSVDVAISAVGATCAANGRLDALTLARARQTLATARNWNYGLYLWLQRAAHQPTLRDCHGFGLSGLAALVDSAEINPQSTAPTRRRELLHVRGQIALAGGRPALALRWFAAALLLAPTPDHALVQAAALGNARAPALGVVHLDHYARIAQAARPEPVRDMPSLHVWLLNRFGYYRKELTSMRSRLQADADMETGAKSSP